MPLRLLDGTGWLPEPLRLAGAEPTVTEPAAAIAPKIDVPGFPRHSEGASTASKIGISGAANDSQEQVSAPGKGRLTTGISQFDDRKNERSLSLFAIIQSVFDRLLPPQKQSILTVREPTPGQQ